MDAGLLAKLERVDVIVMLPDLFEKITEELPAVMITEQHGDWHGYPIHIRNTREECLQLVLQLNGDKQNVLFLELPE